MSKSKQVFRCTISADMMSGTVEALQHYRSVYGLNKDATDLLIKFEKELVGIGYGTAKPAYVTTGVKKQSSINLDSLGASEEEKQSVFQEGRYNNPAEMDDAVNDQLTWMINHPEVDSKDMPAVEEFMRGGKYYANTDSGIEHGSNNSSNSSSSDIDSIGSDEFINVSKNKDDDDDAALASLFSIN